MQPSGLLSISGLASSTPFLRDFFAKWKVRPFFVAREEYKNVANQFTQVCIVSYFPAAVCEACVMPLQACGARNLQIHVPFMPGVAYQGC